MTVTGKKEELQKSAFKMTHAEAKKNLLIYFTTGVPQPGMPLDQGVKYERLPVVVAFPYQTTFRRIFKYDEEKGIGTEIYKEDLYAMIARFGSRFARLDNGDAQKYCLAHVDIVTVTNLFLRRWCRYLNHGTPKSFLISGDDIKPSDEEYNLIHSDKS
jgi:hypothetical protein